MRAGPPLSPSTCRSMGTNQQNFSPVRAVTTTLVRHLLPTSFSCAVIALVRSGTAHVSGEFGRHCMRSGDVLALAANSPCGAEPDPRTTITTICLDRDFVLDQFYWQHSSLFSNRVEASAFLASRHSVSGRVARLGERQSSRLSRYLDELVRLSSKGVSSTHFFRAQTLIFAILDVVVPRLGCSCMRSHTTNTSYSSTQFLRPRSPLEPRQEAQKIAQMLSAEISRNWFVSDLARAVHLSPSQARRVFAQAYGKTPIAYLTWLRVHRMAHLLHQTNLSASSIAREVGWRDSDFAARQFRRAFGVSPRTYRKGSRQEPG